MSILRRTGLLPAFLISMSIVLFFAACERKRSANIFEETRTLTTYHYSDPNPVPLVAAGGSLQRKAYPYFAFDGYSHEGIDEEWVVIQLINDYIEVSILPEVGGKIYGAKEIATGKEFIYENSVKKFRDIASRGPWTSGGIEFNFSSYGHTPVSAAPVDYLIRENEDGSVSAIVGSMDLSSRTEWRVKITLPKDKAHFQTESFYYNPTPLGHRDYVWLTAAAKAAEDLEFYFPGNVEIGHDGDANPWPIDEEGRDLAVYRNNAFGSSKSYHVFGEKSEFYGGYWHDEDFGFGNWSHYSDMPGKKLWLWALSRQGGIWEDLLTDTDGQYVEIQSGRFFHQPSDRSIVTPFYHEHFYPWASNRWEELWFPIKEIGGMKAASPYAVLNFEQDGRQAVVALMALQSIQDELAISIEGNPVSNTMVSLDPLEVYYDTLDIADLAADVRIVLGANKLVYNSRPDALVVDRPVENELNIRPETAAEHYRMGRHHIAHASFDRAMENFYAALEADPAYTASYVGLADVYYRRGKYDRARKYARTALSHNAYDADANQIYGVVTDRLGEDVKALEAFGWAARSPKYRSGAYASMAELYLRTGRPERAEEFANRSLGFNRQNINGYKALAVSYRKQQKRQEARSVLETILELDPLNHFARFEQYLLEPNDRMFEEFSSLIRNELPHETYLELAVYYHKLGLDNDAVTLLQQWNRQPEMYDRYKGLNRRDIARMQQESSSPMIYYWLAYLTREQSPQTSREYLEEAVSGSPYLNFPFRLESIPVLEWAEEQNSSWKNSYYLGLIHWHIGRREEALRRFTQLGETPDYAPFYLARGLLRDQLNESVDGILSDYLKANELAPDEWRTWNELITYHLGEGNAEVAVEYAERAMERFPDTDGIELSYADALLHNKQYEACVDLLEQIRVLPSEHARGSRVVYERATMLAAVQKIRDAQYGQALDYIEKAMTWPENLGIGKPYDPDVRIQNYLASYVHEQLGDHQRAEERYNDVISYTEAFPDRRGDAYYAGVLALVHTGQYTRARQQLNEWQAAQPDSPIVRWAVAHFNNDTQTVNRIMQQNRDNLSFRMTTEVLSIRNSPAVN